MENKGGGSRQQKTKFMARVNREGKAFFMLFINQEWRLRQTKTKAERQRVRIAKKSRAVKSKKSKLIRRVCTLD